MQCGAGITRPGTRTVDTRIAELRRALGDDPRKPRYIETQYRRRLPVRRGGGSEQ